MKNDGWEYAPMFNMKFHADERSMDMTRRRRWHRKMVPSAEFNTISSTDGNIVGNTDVVFRMQSQVTPTVEATPKTDEEQQQQVTPDTSKSNKEIKIELNAPRMYLSFKSNSTERE